MQAGQTACSSSDAIHEWHQWVGGPHFERKKMPYKVPLTWVRRANVVEHGGASVVVNNPNDLQEIKSKVEAKDFHEFITTNREYDEESWSFAPILTEQDNDCTPSDNGSEPV